MTSKLLQRPFRNLSGCATIGLLLVLGVDAQAQGYPNKQVNIICPYLGGPSDFMGRLLAEKLGKLWGQTVVYEARTGGGGNLAVAQVAKAPADGYTLLVTAQPPLVINQYLYSKMRFDPVADLDPIIMLAGQPMMLAVHPSIKANSVAEFVTLAKSRELTFSSGGHGTTPHLASEIFMKAVGIKAVHVPYREVTQISTAVLSGVVDFAFMGPRVLEYAEAGTMRILAQTGETRAPLAPNLPTMLELGLGYHLETWNGILAPKGTPPEILQKIARDTQTVMAMPDVAEKLRVYGLDPMIKTGAEFARAMEEERKIWEKAVRESGARVD